MHSATKIGLFNWARHSAKSFFVAMFSVLLALLGLSAPTVYAGSCTSKVCHRKL